MFQVENAVPFRNGMILRGRFTVPGVRLLPGEVLVVEDTSQMVRFNGVMNANYTHDPSNPRYHISVAFDGDYQSLVGKTLKKLM